MNTETPTAPRPLYHVSANGFSATADAWVTEEASTGMDHLWFLSMVGSQASVRAIAAALVKQHPDSAILKRLWYDGDPQSHPDGAGYDEDGRSVAADGLPWTKFVTRYDAGDPWRMHVTRLSLTRACQAIIYSAKLEYNREDRDFILVGRPGEGLPVRLHYRFAVRRLGVPIHPDWDGWLWERGCSTGEIKPLPAAGVSAWSCSPSEEALRAAISQAVMFRRLTVKPQEAVPYA